MSEGGSGSAWGRVYQAVMRDPALSIEARGIYGYLASFADANGRCYPDSQTIMDEIGVSKDRYYKYLHELEESGILTIERGKRSSGGFANNTYQLYQPCPGNKETAYPENKETARPGNKETVCPVFKETARPDFKDTNRIYNRPYKQTNINKERKNQKERDHDRAAAVETICTILNSRRWKHSLKPQGGMRSLHKPDSFSWADMIEAAEDCVAQYPHPTEKGQNELIGWDALNYYLRLLLADDTADFPKKYERHFFSKRPEM